MYRIKDVFWKNIRWLRAKTLSELKEKLLSKLYTKVARGELDKHTYREVYYTLEEDDIKDINKTLEYELWVKIYLY